MLQFRNVGIATFSGSFFITFQGCEGVTARISSGMRLRYVTAFEYKLQIFIKYIALNINTFQYIDHKFCYANTY